MENVIDLEIELAKKILGLKDGSLIEAKEHILNATELIIKKRRGKNSDR